jgi:proteasome lid subunit RPN8/RPN11
MLKTLEHAKGLLFDEEKKEDKKEDEKHLAEKPPAALPEPEEAAEPEVSVRAESAAAPAKPQDKI